MVKASGNEDASPKPFLGSIKVHSLPLLNGWLGRSESQTKNVHVIPAKKAIKKTKI